MAAEKVFEEAREFTGAIIFCPICCTNVDADGYGWQDVECNNCDTSFKVNIDPDIVAEHARFG